MDCTSHRLVKNGFSSGNQRWRCANPGCNYSYVESDNGHGGDRKSGGKPKSKESVNRAYRLRKQLERDIDLAIARLIDSD